MHFKKCIWINMHTYWKIFFCVVKKIHDLGKTKCLSYKKDACSFWWKLKKKKINIIEKTNKHNGIHEEHFKILPGEYLYGDTQKNECEPVKESEKVYDENPSLLETWKLNHGPYYGNTFNSDHRGILCYIFCILNLTLQKNQPAVPSFPTHPFNPCV
jgi:hypothetical protein